MLLPFWALCVSAQADSIFAVLAAKGNNVYAASAQTDNLGYLKKAKVNDLFLQDSTLLLTAGHMQWRTVNDDGKSLKVYCAGRGYLSVGGNDNGERMVNLTDEGKASDFKTIQNCLATTYGGKTMFLVLRREQDFCFVEERLMNNPEYSRTGLQAMPPQGNVSQDGHGVKVFEGHFTPKQLSSAIDDATTAVDLTKAVLPLKMQDFTYSEPANCLVYVRDNALGLIPDSMRNVVCMSGNGAHLAREMNIVDGKRFYAPVEFTVGKDSLHYMRYIPQDGWNTLVLPFSAHVLPQVTSLYEPTGIAGNEITVEQRSGLIAGTPYLLRLNCDTTGFVAVTFTADEGSKVVADTLRWCVGRYCGTFSRFAPVCSEGAYMFMSHNGYTFSRVADGSYLLPFRCGFMFDTAVQSRAVSLPGYGITKTPNVNAATGTARQIYGIEGMRVPRPGHGIYIIDGKKKYIKANEDIDRF